MDKIYNVAEWLANYFDAMSATAFVTVLFGYKKKGILYIILTFMFTLILSYFQVISEDSFIQGLIIYSMLLVYEFLLLKGKIAEMLTLPLFFIITLIITNMITVYGVMLVTNTEMSMVVLPGSMPRVATLIINKLSVSVILMSLVLFIKRYKLDSKEIILAMSIVFSTIFISSIIINITKEGQHNIIEEKQLMLITIALVIICIVACILIYIINRQNKYKMENHILLSHQDFEKSNLKRVQESYEQATILRHDVKHHLGIVIGLLKEGNTQEIEKYIEEVIGKRVDGDITYFTSNTILNALLNEKGDYCSKNNINFKVEISGTLPDENEMDLGLVISNLLENAIEAELQEEIHNRKVILVLRQLKDMYVISVENYISKSILRGRGVFKTSKKDKSKHGIGLKSVIRTVDKLNGSIEFNETNNMFQVSILADLNKRS